jgi:hypothetical protein
LKYQGQLHSISCDLIFAIFQYQWIVGIEDGFSKDLKGNQAESQWQGNQEQGTKC